MADSAQHNLDNSMTENFMVHNIYIKDLSFEAPNTPHIFSLNWEPKIDFDLTINSDNVDADLWESLLNVTVKVSLKIEENKSAQVQQAPQDLAKEFETAFIVEVKLAGLFTIVGYDKEQTDKILGTTVPTLLFPYVRETISTLVLKGGFPQLILPPINFDTMYEKHLAEKNQETTTDQEQIH